MKTRKIFDETIIKKYLNSGTVATVLEVENCSLTYFETKNGVL